jgi:hypothetical protein
VAAVARHHGEGEPHALPGVPPRDPGLTFADCAALWEWSVGELAGFWAAVREFFDLDEISGYDAVLAPRSGG